MGKLKQLDIENKEFIDKLDVDYEAVQAALSYSTMLWSVKECVNQYGMLTVFADILETLTREEVK